MPVPPEQRNPFGAYTPTDDERVSIHELRRLCGLVFDMLSDIGPSRERSLAVQRLEECVAWGEKAIVYEGAPKRLSIRPPHESAMKSSHSQSFPAVRQQAKPENP
jgi:hypothetical protein